MLLMLPQFSLLLNHFSFLYFSTLPTFFNESFFLLSGPSSAKFLIIRQEDVEKSLLLFDLQYFALPP